MGLASTVEREASIRRRRMVSEWKTLELGQLFYAGCTGRNQAEHMADDYLFEGVAMISAEHRAWHGR